MWPSRALPDALSAIADALRSAVGRRLERGEDASPLAREASAVWARRSARGVARPVALPSIARVIGVGGAVLGGAGKTPLAIAIARELSRRGELTAIVGHAYRARPGHARVVSLNDPVGEVGDDALLAARLLADTPVRVIVARDRAEALAHAASLGFRTLVADGLLQTTPRRVAVSILTLDATAPWGAGFCPPAGDLRAPREALLAAADLVAVLGPDDDAFSGVSGIVSDTPANALRIASRITGATEQSGRRHDLAALAGISVGLLLTVARPERIEAALTRDGIRPRVVIALADHAIPSRADLARAARADVALWLTTARCAVKLPASLGPAPVLALDHHLDVTELCNRI